MDIIQLGFPYQKENVMTGHGPLQDYNYLTTPWDFTTFTTDTSPHLASIFRVLSSDAKLR